VALALNPRGADLARGAKPKSLVGKEL